MPADRPLHQIFLILSGQAALLTLFAAAALQISVSGGDGENSLGGNLLLLALLFGFSCLMFISWAAFEDLVETGWSVSARKRVREWLRPALIWTGGLAAMAGLSAPFWADLPITFPALFAAATISILPPLAVTGFLMASALKQIGRSRRDIAALESGIARQETPPSARLAISVAALAGRTKTGVNPAPKGFTLANLTAKPWHDNAEIPWIAGFEKHADQIKQEALNVLEEHLARIEKYDYPGLEGEQWRAFKLVTRHRECAENLALCPVTARLLKTIPGYPGFRDAMFSILERESVIAPHRDVSNVFLTMHLGLVTRGNGYLEAGGVKRQWEEGKAFVFDSSYEHCAANNSNETRIVLLVDFMHPELTDDERAWLHEHKI